MRDLERLRAAFAALEARIGEAGAAWGARAPRVSAWSVAQQVEHTLRAAHATLGAAVSLAPEGGAAPAARSARAWPNLAGRFVLAWGRIPRGKGRAPEPVLPGAEPDARVSRDLLQRARQTLEALAPRWRELSRWPGATPHPALGLFSAEHWVRFTRIHTEHHLALVEDILRARS